MDIKSKVSKRRRQIWLDRSAGDVASFEKLVSQHTSAADYPLAKTIKKNIPVYNGAALHGLDPSSEIALDLMAEWVDVFHKGPGVIVIEQSLNDNAIVDTASDIFHQIIKQQHDSGEGGADHFAAKGANDRIWNSLEKHCMADPENFIQYYSNPGLALPSLAWLGSGYQVTAQVNLVRPGGKAQTPHRDYHLGFMTPEQIERFPRHVHDLSPALTLQGAIAHCDMVIESGPTQLLPFSQQFLEGYIAFGRPEFQEVFKNYSVQLPLKKGDMLFFNPAVMHGAGTNHTKDVQRLVNLFQVGSAFGRSIETIDRFAMTKKLYPHLLKSRKAASLTDLELQNVIAASAEGYSFPTNLDRDPPIGGLAPKSMQGVVTQALLAGDKPAEINVYLKHLKAKQRAN